MQGGGATRHKHPCPVMRRGMTRHGPRWLAAASRCGRPQPWRKAGGAEINGGICRYVQDVWIHTPRAARSEMHAAAL